ncbi:glycosyltransferase family 2 protein [Lutibacter sp.]|uniref:glycosyltransferase family 2 protein n=1 Tax=Lutibacter sp. TaxID=1925666 RepID=UPI0035696718
MISILIPVYNYKIKILIDVLNKQLINTKIKYEIICLDDCSNLFTVENECVGSILNVRLIKLECNIGRSKIRNLLVEKAKYEWLLFLDADVLPETNNFIFNYIKCIQFNKGSVYCGGIIYEKTRPISENYLRWFYGKSREEISQSKRSKKPYKSFLGANFLINKSVFESARFNDELYKYGYEDVLFAEDLKKNNIIIVHIENPVFHLGLEDNAVFIEKTKQAIENLYKLNTQHLLTEDSIKILKVFQKLKTYKLTWFFRNLYIFFHKKFEFNLKSKKPNMFVFDMYKLSYLCFIANVNRSEVV